MRAALGLVLVLAFAAGGSATADEPPSLDAIKRFRDFQVYYAGRSFDGLPLRFADMSRVPVGKDVLTTRRYFRMVSFSYGDPPCDPPPQDGGCSFPLTIQALPACQIAMSPTKKDRRLRSRTIRGIPARFKGPSMLVLVTNRTTLVIYGNDPQRVAEALVPVNQVDRGRRLRNLPPPARGAVIGELACTREIHRAKRRIAP